MLHQMPHLRRLDVSLDRYNQDGSLPQRLRMAVLPALRCGAHLRYLDLSFLGSFGIEVHAIQLGDAAKALTALTCLNMSDHLTGGAMLNNNVLENNPELADRLNQMMPGMPAHLKSMLSGELGGMATEAMKNQVLFCLSLQQLFMPIRELHQVLLIQAAAKTPLGSTIKRAHCLPMPQQFLM